MSTSFHPQTDGQTERLNRVLEDMLRYYVCPSQDNWDEYLLMVEFAYNNLWQEFIKTTHFLLNYGQHASTHVNRRISESQVSAATNLALAMSNVISEAKKHLLAAQQRQKSYVDTKRRDVSYEVGSEVLLSTSNIKLKTPGARKLLPRWIGPFEIVKRIGVVAYRLKLPETMRIHNVFHVSLLKPYKANGRV